MYALTDSPHPYSSQPRNSAGVGRRGVGVRVFSLSLRRRVPPAEQAEQAWWGPRGRPELRTFGPRVTTPGLGLAGRPGGCPFDSVYEGSHGIQPALSALQAGLFGRGSYSPGQAGDPDSAACAFGHGGADGVTH
jgi:hypothetical protein